MESLNTSSLKPDPDSTIESKEVEVILYLDLDGVLHSNFWIFDEKGERIDDTFIHKDILISILDRYPNLRIVIHSAWRYCFGPTSTIWRLPEPIRKKTLRTTNPRITSRWNSIEDDVARHKVKYYVGLDDSMDEFPAECDKMIYTDPKMGIGEKGIQELLIQRLDKLFAQAKSDKLKLSK